MQIALKENRSCNIRVKFSLPKDAAYRLRQLAVDKNPTLLELGVLAVQLSGHEVVSLPAKSTLKDQSKHGEPSEHNETSTSQSTQKESEFGSDTDTAPELEELGLIAEYDGEQSKANSPYRVEKSQNGTNSCAEQKDSNTIERLCELPDNNKSISRDFNVGTEINTVQSFDRKFEEFHSFRRPEEVKTLNKDSQISSQSTELISIRQLLANSKQNANTVSNSKVPKPRKVSGQPRALHSKKKTHVNKSKPAVTSRKRDSSTNVIKHPLLSTHSQSTLANILSQTGTLTRIPQVSEITQQSAMNHTVASERTPQSIPQIKMGRNTHNYSTHESARTVSTLNKPILSTMESQPVKQTMSLYVQDSSTAESVHNSSQFIKQRQIRRRRSLGPIDSMPVEFLSKTPVNASVPAASGEIIEQIESSTGSELPGGNVFGQFLKALAKNSTGDIGVDSKKSIMEQINANSVDASAFRFDLEYTNALMGCPKPKKKPRDPSKKPRTSKKKTKKSIITGVPNNGLASALHNANFNQLGNPQLLGSGQNNASEIPVGYQIGLSPWGPVLVPDIALKNLESVPNQIRSPMMGTIPEEVGHNGVPHAVGHPPQSGYTGASPQQSPFVALSNQNSVQNSTGSTSSHSIATQSSSHQVSHANSSSHSSFTASLPNNAVVQITCAPFLNNQVASQTGSTHSQILNSSTQMKSTITGTSVENNNPSTKNNLQRYTPPFPKPSSVINTALNQLPAQQQLNTTPPWSPSPRQSPLLSHNGVPTTVQVTQYLDPSQTMHNSGVNNVVNPPIQRLHQEVKTTQFLNPSRVESPSQTIPRSVLNNVVNTPIQGVQHNARTTEFMHPMSAGSPSQVVPQAAFHNNTVNATSIQGMQQQIGTTQVSHPTTVQGPSTNMNPQELLNNPAIVAQYQQYAQIQNQFLPNQMMYNPLIQQQANQILQNQLLRNHSNLQVQGNGFPVQNQFVVPYGNQLFYVSGVPQASINPNPTTGNPAVQYQGITGWPAQIAFQQPTVTGNSNGLQNQIINTNPHQIILSNNSIPLAHGNINQGGTIQGYPGTHGLQNPGMAGIPYGYTQVSTAASTVLGSGADVNATARLNHYRRKAAHGRNSAPSHLSSMVQSNEPKVVVSPRSSSVPLMFNETGLKNAGTEVTVVRNTPWMRECGNGLSANLVVSTATLSPRVSCVEKLQSVGSSSVEHKEMPPTEMETTAPSCISDTTTSQSSQTGGVMSGGVMPGGVMPGGVMPVGVMPGQDVSVAENDDKLTNAETKITAEEPKESKGDDCVEKKDESPKPSVSLQFISTDDSAAIKNISNTAATIDQKLPGDEDKNEQSTTTEEEEQEIADDRENGGSKDEHDEKMCDKVGEESFQPASAAVETAEMDCKSFIKESDITDKIEAKEKKDSGITDNIEAKDTKTNKEDSNNETEVSADVKLSSEDKKESEMETSEGTERECSKDDDKNTSGSEIEKELCDEVNESEVEEKDQRSPDSEISLENTLVCNENMDRNSDNSSKMNSEIVEGNNDGKVIPIVKDTSVEINDNKVEKDELSPKSEISLEKDLVCNENMDKIDDVNSVDDSIDENNNEVWLRETESPDAMSNVCVKSDAMTMTEEYVKTTQTLRCRANSNTSSESAASSPSALGVSFVHDNTVECLSIVPGNTGVKRACGSNEGNGEKKRRRSKRLQEL